jgi:hypothetical protein
MPRVWDPSFKLAAKDRRCGPGGRLLGMESRGPGIYNPLLERCPASPSPHPGLRRSACAVKMSHWVGALRSHLWPGLLKGGVLPGVESWLQLMSLENSWKLLRGGVQSDTPPQY